MILVDTTVVIDYTRTGDPKVLALVSGARRRDLRGDPGRGAGGGA